MSELSKTLSKMALVGGETPSDSLAAMGTGFISLMHFLSVHEHKPGKTPSETLADLWANTRESFDAHVAERVEALKQQENQS